MALAPPHTIKITKTPAPVLINGKMVKMLNAPPKREKLIKKFGFKEQAKKRNKPRKKKTMKRPFFRNVF